jgi:hypothetical protein
LAVLAKVKEEAIAVWVAGLDWVGLLPGREMIDQAFRTPKAVYVTREIVVVERFGTGDLAAESPAACAPKKCVPEGTSEGW